MYDSSFIVVCVVHHRRTAIAYCSGTDLNPSAIPNWDKIFDSSRCKLRNQVDAEEIESEPNLLNKLFFHQILKGISQD